MYGKSVSYYVMHDGQEGMIKMTASRMGKNGEWEHYTDIYDLPETENMSNSRLDDIAADIVATFVQMRAKPFLNYLLSPNDGEYAQPN